MSDGEYKIWFSPDKVGDYILRAYFKNYYK